MPMFDVYLNGKKVSTAGVGKVGVLSANVTWVRRTVDGLSATRPNTAAEELRLHIGGLLPATKEYVRWLDHDLKLEDEVRIRVVEKGSADRPRSRVKRNAAEELRAQKQYVREMAKRFGWKIVTQNKKRRP